MSDEFELQVVSDHIPELLATLDARMSRVTRKAALDCVGKAQANVQANNTIDTGAMWGGIFAVTQQENHYASAAGQGESKRPGHVIADPAPLDGSGMDAAVVAVMDYSYWIELGTGRMPAHPFLIPAHDAVSAAIEELARDVFADL